MIQRSPFVAEEAKRRAKGICELCQNQQRELEDNEHKSLKIRAILDGRAIHFKKSTDLSGCKFKNTELVNLQSLL